MLNTNQKKRKELADYLGISDTEIQIKDEDSTDIYNEYYTSEGTFYVMTEEESITAVKNDIESLIDDIGMDAFTPTFQETIMSKYIKDDWFQDACKEFYESYASDIENEEDRVCDGKYANRLIQECIENNIISDEEIDENGEYTGKKDLVDELTVYLYEDVENNYDSYAEWYKFDYGNENFTYVIKNYDVGFDIDGIAEECIEMDGYGHSISSWDGETIELDTFYAYKVDEYDNRE